MFFLVEIIFWCFPTGFEYVGPRIRIPREKQGIYRLETSGNPQFGRKMSKISSDFVFVLFFAFLMVVVDVDGGIGGSGGEDNDVDDDTISTLGKDELITELGFI